MVTRLATQQSLFRRFAPYGFTLYIGKSEEIKYNKKRLKPARIYIKSSENDSIALGALQFLYLLQRNTKRIYCRFYSSPSAAAGTTPLAFPKAGALCERIYFVHLI